MRPEQFQDPDKLALFGLLRYSVATVSLLTGEPTCLESEAWRTIPWARATWSRGSIHKLVDLIYDMSPLQPAMHVAIQFPFGKQDCPAQHTREQVCRLLLQLFEWRQSAELGLRKRLKDLVALDQSTLRYVSRIHSIEFDRPDDLYELAIFNMILIYLCRFLMFDQSLRDEVNAAVLVTGTGLKHDQIPGVLRTPLTLPIDDPITRARIAAREIGSMWQCLTSNGLFGFATLYLSLPMHVARNLLICEGDPAASELVESCQSIPLYWVGVANQENVSWQHPNSIVPSSNQHIRRLKTESIPDVP